MTRFLLLLAGWLVFTSGASAAPPPGVRLFDFGQEKSPVWPGFTQVTPKTVYTPERGYGWTSRKGLLGRASGARGRRSAPDALMGDCIWTHYKSDFIIDVKQVKGPLRVKAYVEGKQVNGRIRVKGYRIDANGREVARLAWDVDKMMAEDYFFKGWDADFDPDEPVWERWADPLHRTETFDVTPKDGKLLLTFRGLCQVHGLIVYPPGMEAKVGAFIADLDKKRKQEFYERYFIRDIPKPEPLPKLSRAERAQGYVVFSRNPSQEVAFHAAPKREDINRPLRLFAARGEYETVAFTVLPLADIPVIDVSVTPLKSGDAELPASAIQIESARYRWEFIGGMTVRPKPMMLTPWTRLSAPARYNRRYFLTVRTPEDARPGVYRGQVRIVAKGRPGTTLPVELRVLPFRLPTTTEAGLSAGYYYYSPRYMLPYARMGKPDHPDVEKWLERDLRLMKRFNLNGFQADTSHYGWKVTDYDKLARGDASGVDLSRLERDLAVCRRVGIDGPGQFFSQRIHNDLLKRKLKMGSPGYRRRVGAFFRILADRVRSGGGPELVAWLSDEVHENPARSWNLDHDDALAFGRIVRKESGGAIRTTLTLMSDGSRGKDYSDLVAACDVTQTHFWDKSRRLIETADRGGHTLWGYNCGNSRYSWGFQVYRNKAGGRWQWHWYTRSDFPYNPMARAGYYVTMYTPNGHFPSPWLVQAREGIDDYRYLRLLETTLKAGGPAKGRKLAREALRDARNLPPFAIKLAGGAAVGGAAKKIFPNPDDFDRLRWRIASAILALGGE